ncbi:MAG: MlaD family protein [Spirochaetia bacterium]|nr:MlaD family protein [Spirochaetia bacterium]
MEETRKIAIRVGMFVVLTLIVFIIMAALVSRWQFKKAGFVVHIKFNFLNNLGMNAAVKIAGGIPVGYVTEIYQKELQTYVTVYLKKELENKIPKKPETIFTIFSSSLMGQKYINIVIPESKEGDEFLKDGDEVTGIDPPSIDQMMLAFSSWFDGKNGGQVLAEIIQETRLFISNLNAIASENRNDIRVTVKQARESFSTLATQLDILMAKLTILSTNFTDISTRNKNDIEVMLTNLSQISREMNTITQRVNSGKGSMGKLLADEELYKTANETLENARDLFQKLKQNPWLLLYKE